MKTTRTLRRALTLLLALALFAGTLTGCGKGSSRQEVTLHVYQGDTVDTSLTDAYENFSINRTILVGDTLYTLGSTYNADDYTEQPLLLSCGLDGSNAQSLPVPTHEYDPDNGYWYAQTLAGTPDGGLYIVSNVVDYGTEDTPYSEQIWLDKLGPDGQLQSSVVMQRPEDIWVSTYNMYVAADGGIWFPCDGGLANVAPDGSVQVRKLENVGSVNGLYNYKGGVLLSYYDTENGNGHLAPIDLATGTLGQELPYPGEMGGSLLCSPNGTLYFNHSTGIYSYDEKTGETEILCNWLDSDIDTSYQANNVFARDDGTFVAVGQGENWDKLLVTQLHYVDPSTLPEKTILSLGCLYSWQLQRDVLRFNRESDTVRITLTDYSIYNTEENGWTGGVTQLNNDIISGRVPDILSLDTGGSLPMESYNAKGLFTDLYPLLDADAELQRSDFLANILAATETDGKLTSIIPYFDIVTLIGPRDVVGETAGWTWDEFFSLLEQYPNLEHAIPDMTRDYLLQMALVIGGDQFIDYTNGVCHFDSPEFIRLLEYAASYDEEINYDEYVDPKELFASGRALLQTNSVWNFDSIRSNTYNMNGAFTYKGFPTADGSSGSAIQPYMQLSISEACPDKAAAWEFIRYYLGYEYQTEQIYSDYPLRVDALQKLADEALNPPENNWDDGIAVPTPRAIAEAAGESVAILDDTLPEEALADEDGADGASDESVAVTDDALPEEPVVYNDDDDVDAEVPSDGEDIAIDGPIAMPEYPAENEEDYWSRPLTQQEVDDMLQLVNSVTTVIRNDQSVLDIIQEETATFFSGDKTAAEVAALIQNRVSTYLSESR